VLFGRASATGVTKKVKSENIFLSEIIFEILNKKILKYKNPPVGRDPPVTRCLQ
jgi:hypothetical protein